MTLELTPPVTERIDVPELTEAQLLRWYQCGRKITYDDGVTAQLAAGNTPSPFPLTQYKCAHCYGWHVGHPAKRIENHRRQVRHAHHQWVKWCVKAAGLGIDPKAPRQFPVAFVRAA